MVLWMSFDLLLIHFSSSLSVTFISFFFGLLLSYLLCAVNFFFKPLTELTNAISMAIYSVPIIVSAFIFSTFLGPDYTGIVLGAMGAFLPIYLSCQNNIELSKDSYLQTSKVFSASKVASFKFVVFPLMLRGSLSSAYVAWTWAVLGSLLGDFSGKRWGVGTLLVGSVTQGKLSNIYSVVFLCLLLSLVGWLFFRIFIYFTKTNNRLEVIENYTHVERTKVNSTYRLGLTLILLLLLDVVLFGQNTLILNFGSIIFPSYFFEEYVNTILVTLIGIVLSMTLSFALAVLADTSSKTAKLLSLPIFITQVTPILAFIPLIAFYFGRGNESIILVVILSTIYPSYLLIQNSLKDYPASLDDLNKVYSGNKSTLLKIFKLPASVGAIKSAVRMTLGRALLGALTAEYLITGTGIGGTIGKLRALLDYQLIWIICVAVILTTLVFDLIFEKLDNFSRF